MYYYIRRLVFLFIILAVIGAAAFFLFGNRGGACDFSFRSIKNTAVNVLDDIGSFVIDTFNSITGKESHSLQSSDDALMKEYEDLIDELNKNLEDVYEEIDKQKENLENATGPAGGLDDYNKANQYRQSKLNELDKLFNSYIDRVSESQLSYARQLYSNAELSINRATSVEQMDTIIAEFKNNISKLLSNSSNNNNSNNSNNSNSNNSNNNSSNSNNNSNNNTNNEANLNRSTYLDYLEDIYDIYVDMMYDNSKISEANQLYSEARADMNAATTVSQMEYILSEFENSLMQLLR